MARTLDPAVHAVRREAFLDAALGLIQTKGYEEMSIQDVLDELDASRGAFYHYFEFEGGAARRRPRANDRDGPRDAGARRRGSDDTAIEKFEGIFTGIARWKGDRPDLVGGAAARLAVG